MGKIIKYGLVAVALFALARGCGCSDKESEQEKKHITTNAYDISEAISNTHTKSSYVSAMKKMGEAKGFILQYMTDETASVNLDGEIRKYIIDGMRDHSLNSEFNVSDYMESFSAFAKEKKSSTRTLDNIIHTHTTFMSNFTKKENEAEFRKAYIEDRKKLGEFLQIGKSMASALDTIANQYQKDKAYFENLAKDLSQENDPAARKLLKQISNYSVMCSRMSNMADYQKQRIGVEIEYIESTLQKDVALK